MKEYRVTKNAGKMIGAIRNPGAGKSIVMTESQAEHLLRTFQIEAIPERDPAKKPEKKPRK